MSGILNSAGSRSGVIGSFEVKKTYVSQLSRGANSHPTPLELNEWATAGGATLPGASDGHSLGSVAGVVIAGGESIKCTVWSFLADWNNDDPLNVVVWANDGGSDFFMKGTNMPTNWSAPTNLMFYNNVLAAGTYTFTVRFGSEDPAYYGIWWGGRGVYGDQSWAALKTEGFIQVDVIGA